MARSKRLSPDPFPLTIDHLSVHGRGLASLEGKQLQVHDALAGESVMVKYLFGRRMRGQAETLEVVTPSADRITPRCPHFGNCSACSLQHLDHTAALAFKQRVMLDRIGDEPREYALAELVEAYLDNCASGKPVSEWS